MRTATFYFHSEERPQLQAFLSQEAREESGAVLVQLFSSILDPDVIREVASAVMAAFPHAVLIGATSDGEIIGGEMREGGIALSVTHFGFTRLKVIEVADEDPFTMGARIAGTLIGDMTRCIIMFADGLKINGDALLRGFASANGSHVPLAGGMSGDMGRFERCYTVCGMSIREGAAVAVALDGESLKVMQNYNLGWKGVGLPMSITRSEGNRVWEIDGKSVVEVYRTFLGDEVVKRFPASATEFPLVLEQGIPVARAMIAVMEDGSALFAGDVPEGSKVRFGVGSPNLINQTIQNKCADMVRGAAESVFVYSCSGRKAFLGEILQKEFAPLGKLAPMNGFFAYGEFFPDKGNERLLNITTTVLALREGEAQGVIADACRASEEVLPSEALLHLVDRISDDLLRFEGANRLIRERLEEYDEAIDKVLIISRTDAQGIIIDVNDHFCRISGYGRTELIGHHHSIVRHPRLPETLFEEMWETIRAGKIWAGELENLGKQGQSYYVKSAIIPIKNSAGEIAEYLMISEDVTEIIESKMKAEAAQKAKSDFLAAMSHEIRTPMNGIIGFTELLEGTSLDTTQRRYVETLRASTKTLLGIVNDILDFSKIESGNMELDITETNLQMEIPLHVGLHDVGAKAKDIRLIRRIDPMLQECLRLDALRLKQVLTNLLGNAIKFTPAGGSVELEISVVETTRELQKLRFAIKDTGIGIPQEKQKKIFEAFSQADTSTTREFGGTGLGLTISSRLVAMMGGTLTLESSPGKGSVFAFEMTALRCDAKNRLAEALASHTLGFISASGEVAEHARLTLKKFEVPFQTLSLEEACQSAVDVMVCIGAETGIAVAQAGYKGALIVIGQNDFRLPNETVVIDDGSSCCSALYNSLWEIVTKREELNSELTMPERFAMKILIAEDYDINRMLISELLRLHGIAPDFALNGEEAVEKVLSQDYDLVLMDVNMPVMDGVEATKQIRKRQTHPIPIIALTANALEGDREKLLALGMDDYISKPIDPKELEALLVRYAPPRAQGAFADPTALDHQNVIDTLVKTLGLDVETVKRLFELFVKSTGDELRALNEGIKEGDYEKIYQSAHKIAGSAGGLMVTTVQEYAKEVEYHSMKRDPYFEYQRTVDAMGEYVAKLSVYTTRGEGYEQ